MPDFADLPVSAAVSLRIAVIIIAGVVAYGAVRLAVGVGVRHILERKAADAGQPELITADLDRRVKTVASLVLRIAGSVIAVIAGLMALDQFGIDIGPAVAGLGVAGIAVGLGAQTLVRDWLAGIFVIVENQYNLGDVVRIAGVEGVVEDLSLRRTTLRDLDGTLHSVPNGQIVVASNLTRLWARVNLDVSVAYDTDIDRASGIIDRIGAELRADPEWGLRMLEAPTVVRVNALADSAVTLKILGQVQAAQQWAVTGELRKRVLAAFAREGIQIPFPHRVIINNSGPGAPTGQVASESDAGEAAASDE